MAYDILKQSLNIIREGSKGFAAEYTSNAKDIFDEAKSFKDNIASSSSSVKETLMRIKSNGLSKMASDWFYQRESETDSSDIDDEFDSGMSNINDDADPSVSSDSLNADQMRDITRGQMNAVYGSAGRISEVNTANTAEIVSSITSGNANILASLNNVNTTLTHISAQFDTFMKYHASVQQALVVENQRKLIGGNSNPASYDGAMSISGIATATKNSQGGYINAASSFGSLTKTMLGQMTPENLVTDALKKIAGYVKVPSTGKTIDELGTKFNQAVGDISHNILSELIESPGFKKLFGDITKMNANRDYRDIAVNSYTTKPAIFDGMTRYSIINTIPEYLKKINESISGQTWNVNNRGELTKGAIKNKFNETTQASFQSSGLSYNASVSLANEAKAIDINISSSDIDMAGRALTMACVMYLHNVVGKTQLRLSELSSISTYVISNAVSALKGANPKKNWVQICMGIMQRLETNTSEGTAFIKNVNKSLKSMIESAETYAATNPFALKTAGVITNDMARNEFINANKIVDDKNNKAKVIDSQIGSNKSNNPMFDMTDYIRGTFDILNRGINVKVTNDVTTDTSGFDPYILKKNIPGTPVSVTKIQNTATKDDSNEGGYLDKMRDALIPKEIRLGMQFFGQAKKNIQGAANEVKEKFNEKRAENGGDNLLNSAANLVSPAANKVIGIGEKVVDKVTGISGKVSNKLLGTKITDSEGNTFRRGGLINDTKDFTKAMIEGHNAERYMVNLKNKMDNGTADISTSDQILAQQVFALMQTAGADGDTNEDMGPIMAAINQIKDEGLRGKLESSVMSMLKRSNVKEKAKSNPLFKILSFAKLGLTKVIAPVVKVIKTVGLVIKNVGGKIVKLLGRVIKDGLIDMKTGTMAVGRSLFGQRQKTDADGNIIQEKQIGLITQIALKPMMKVLSIGVQSIAMVAKGVKIFYGKVFTLIGKIGKKLVSGVQWLGGKIKSGLSGLSEKFANSSLGKKLSGLKGKASDEFNESGGMNAFIAGFTKVFKDSKMARDKSRAKANLQTASDVTAGEISEMMSGKKESVVSKIGNWVEGIFNKITGDDGSNETVVDNNSNDETVTPGITVSSNTGEASAAESGSVDRASKITMTSGGKSGGVLSSLKGMVSGGGATAGAEGAAAAGGMAGKLGGLLGGLSVGILGLIKVVAAAVAGLSGFKALTKLFSDILQDSVKPLNKMFKQLIKVLKPIVKTVTKILTQVFECINSIMMSIIDTIQPLIESIEPIISAIFTALEPILSLVSVLVKVIMAPLMGVMKFVVVPILRQVGNTLEIISGVLQFATGIIMTALGSILTGIGAIIKILPFGGGSGILDTGLEMVKSGASMTTSGLHNIADGTKKLIAGALDPLDISGVNSEKKDEETKDETPKTDKESTSTGGSAMDGIVGNGDTYNDNSIHNIYGGGNITTNQTAYGNNMNMKDRGCGPSALADAYARRTGRNVNPVRIAASMSRHGTYDPNRGTSVGGFIAAGNAAGMNLRTGNVTRQSLKRATPNNPITVVGSGPDFATKSGNIHYMNVVGSDRSGAVYVSNPLNGNVRRRPLDSVLHSSVAGIYGSGDSDDVTSGYQFDDSVTDAMNNLSNIAGSLLGIFSGKTDEDDANDLINAEQDKEAIKQTQLTLGDDFSKYETKGYELFKKDYPKRDGESDEDYQKRYEKVKDKYTSLAAKDTVIKKNTSVYNEINKAADTTNKAANNAAQATYDAGDAMEEGKSEDSTSDSGAGSSAQGKVLLTGLLKDGNAWNSYKNRDGVKSFIENCFKTGMGGPEVATIISTGIWEDGGDKIFGNKDLNAITYDANGQQATGIMNWVESGTGGKTLKSQLDFIHKTYFDKKTTDSRGKVGADAKTRYIPAFKKATGRSDVKLKSGDKYGEFTNNEDLIEGSAHFFGNALVPESFNNGSGGIPQGEANYIGTAAAVYNWMIDQGYLTVDTGGVSSNGFALGGDGKLGSMSLKEFIKKYEHIGTDYDNCAGVQCVDTARLYTDKVLGFDLGPTPTGGASGYWTNPTSAVTDNFDKVSADGGKTIPKAGWIPIWGCNNAWGHIGVTSDTPATSSSFESVEQNWNCGNEPMERKSHDYSSSQFYGFLKPHEKYNDNILGIKPEDQQKTVEKGDTKSTSSTSIQTFTPTISDTMNSIHSGATSILSDTYTTTTTTFTAYGTDGSPSYWTAVDPNTNTSIKFDIPKMAKLSKYPTKGLTPKKSYNNNSVRVYEVPCRFNKKSTQIEIGDKDTKTGKAIKKWVTIKGQTTVTAPNSISTVSTLGEKLSLNTGFNIIGNGDINDDFIIDNYDGFNYFGNGDINDDFIMTDYDNINGNGDIESIFPTSDYVDNGYNNSNDANIITNQYSYDASNIPVSKYVYNEINTPPTTTTIQNKYQVGARNTNSRANLTAILNNTYNIRSTRIETLLTKMIGLMDKKPTASTPSKSTGSTADLFENNEIPQSVFQLSIG